MTAEYGRNPLDAVVRLERVLRANEAWRPAMKGGGQKLPSLLTDRLARDLAPEQAEAMTTRLLSTVRAINARPPGERGVDEWTPDDIADVLKALGVVDDTTRPRDLSVSNVAAGGWRKRKRHQRPDPLQEAS